MEQLRCHIPPKSPWPLVVLSTAAAFPGMLGQHPGQARGARELMSQCCSQPSTSGSCWDFWEAYSVLPGVLRGIESQFPTSLCCSITYLLSNSFLSLPSVPNPLSFPSQRSFSSSSLFQGLIWRNPVEDRWTGRHKLRLEMEAEATPWDTWKALGRTLNPF